MSILGGYYFLATSLSFGGAKKVGDRKELVSLLNSWSILSAMRLLPPGPFLYFALQLRASTSQAMPQDFGVLPAATLSVRCVFENLMAHLCYSTKFPT